MMEDVQMAFAREDHVQMDIFHLNYLEQIAGSAIYKHTWPL
jgi:hypothetical protein